MNVCKQCGLGNHAGCTKRIYAADDSPLCTCTHQTPRTPLEKLDDAIHEYIEATSEAKGDTDSTRAVAGWVLGVETTALVQQDDALPLGDAQWYASGPQTTTTQAIGLARYVAGVYETHIVGRTLYGGGE